ncbi:MAG: metal-binding protein [Pseudonocardiales bacterium]|nr:cupredoxin domain-containing protein [Pseudonocardiales bacterium]PZS30049.1 MAG: metal-binding protein [Pseudonocardiales bacterium]
MTLPTATIRLRPTAVLLTMLVAVLGLVLGCGGGAGSPAGDGGGPAAPGATDTIVMKSFTFTPATLTVAPGAKIMVVNQDQAPHTVTANDKSFDSGNISGGQRGAVTAPTKPGSYPYICTIHQYMTGTLIVR